MIDGQADPGQFSNKRGQKRGQWVLGPHCMYIDIGVHTYDPHPKTNRHGIFRLEFYGYWAISLRKLGLLG